MRRHVAEVLLGRSSQPAQFSTPGRSCVTGDLKDYISQNERSFSPSALLNLFKQRKVFVALHDQRVVGTASLDGHAVRTMFVAPDVQRRGIGRRLMEAVEAAARIARVDVLVVPSSVTAEQFYARLEFRAVRDSFHGKERTVIMERTLTKPRP